MSCGGVDYGTGVLVAPVGIALGCVSRRLAESSLFFLERGLKLCAEFFIEPPERGQPLFEIVVDVALSETQRGVEQDFAHRVLGA
jgi:hypothetical protein